MMMMGDGCNVVLDSPPRLPTPPFGTNAAHPCYRRQSVRALAVPNRGRLPAAGGEGWWLLGLV